MKKTTSRRDFLIKSSIASLGILGFSVCSGGRKDEEAIERRQLHQSSDQVVIRRDISQLKPDDPSLEMLRDAVREMKKKSERNLLHAQGWYAHARVHDMFCFTSVYKHQIHFTWLFYPWHRAYLYFLEKKLREVISEPSLALHYWDWTKNPHIPEQYWGDDNPLYDFTRMATPKDIIPYDYFNVESYLRAPTFKSFGGGSKLGPQNPFTEGVVEQGVHNSIHNWIGGNMDNFATAADDPIFAGHHGNVDRLWEAWLAADPSHRNPDDPEFLNYVFHFTDQYGRPTAIKTADLLDTEKLGYSFENLDFTKTFSESNPRLSGHRSMTTLDTSVKEDERKSIAKAISDGYRRVVIEFNRFKVPGLPLAIRVFLHEKGIDISKRDEKIAYVTTITVLPVNVPNTAQLEPYVIMQAELTAECAALVSSGKQLAITLEPVKAPGRKIPDVTVSIEDVRIKFDEG